MAEENIFIESLHQIEHFYAHEEVQKKAWDMDDTSIVPAHLLITAQKNGGLVLGAFNEKGEMVGCLFGFLGTQEPTSEHEGLAERLKHCSHLMGVIPEYQTKGVGYLLKLRQREHALYQGLNLATWTYDPLESVNANLNVCKLGVVCKTYLRDIYGELPDARNVGLATDRFEIEWWITSERVVNRIEKGGEKLSLDEMLEVGARQVNVATLGSDGLLRPSVYSLSTTAEDVVVEIPADFQGIKAADMSLATEWRMHTRELFEHYFDAGYVMTEFISEVTEGLRHSYYVLRKGFMVS
jgi:predicted GNAT superfamily acetyltransferase